MEHLLVRLHRIGATMQSDERITAVLHDGVEDCEVSLEWLRTDVFRAGA